MNIKLLSLSILVLAQLGWQHAEARAVKTRAQIRAEARAAKAAKANSGLDELDPFSPNIEEQLNALDSKYEQSTGVSSHLVDDLLDTGFGDRGCVREACAVWAQVVKSRQQLYLYQNGQLIATWPVSTGLEPGHGTPNFDTHPNGRIYDAYTSGKYPGGDYNGLGNMPYAVFIKGGFAIHGTGRGNWRKLGRKASHGCVRVHPDNALIFNRMVRENGIKNVWITVQD